MRCQKLLDELPPDQALRTISTLEGDNAAELEKCAEDFIKYTQERYDKLGYLITEAEQVLEFGGMISLQRTKSLSNMMQNIT